MQRLEKFANYYDDRNRILQYSPMLTRYIQAAMRQATYELLKDGTFYGEIPLLTQ